METVKNISANSDSDVLIASEYQISLLQLVQIEQELSDKLGIRIDLITKDSPESSRLFWYSLKKTWL
jgi:predicted nucleotidyltransferase